MKGFFSSAFCNLTSFYDPFCPVKFWIQGGKESNVYTLQFLQSTNKLQLLTYFLFILLFHHMVIWLFQHSPSLSYSWQSALSILSLEEGHQCSLVNEVPSSPALCLFMVFHPQHIGLVQALITYCHNTFFFPTLTENGANENMVNESCFGIYHWQEKFRGRYGS